MRSPARCFYALLLLVGAVLSESVTAGAARAQDFLSAGGKPTFATLDPVEQGYINVAVGNLHLQFTLGSPAQRGDHSAVYLYSYNSDQVWAIFCGNTGCTWGAPPFNGLGALGAGWDDSTNGGRSDGSGGGLGPFNWVCPSGSGYCGEVMTQPDGTNRYFPLVNWPPCSPATVYAWDSSGYAYSCNPDGSTSIYDPNGTNVGSAPGVYCTNVPNDGSTYQCAKYSEDRNGNYWQYAVNQYKSFHFTDTLGREGILNSSNQPVFSQYANQFPYAQATIPVSTNFGQSGVKDYSGTRGVLQSLSLPDGSTYSFKYDCDSSTGNAACGSPAGQSGYYGLLVSMTLPTGGTVNYGYTTFKDSLSNKRRWLTSRTGGGTWTYSPAVISTSQQQVTIVAPDSAKKIYTYTLNNGAWPTVEKFYDTTGSLLATITNSFDFSNSCAAVYSGCKGAAYIRLATTQTSVPGPGGTLTKQRKYTYDSPQLGDVTAVQEWGFQPGTSPSFSSTPDRATYTPHVIIGNNIHRPQSVTVCNNSGSDSACTGGGSKVAQTLYTYDSYGSNCPSGGLATMTGVLNFDQWLYSAYYRQPPYTQRGNLTQVQRLISGSTYATTQLCYDETGQMTAEIDPNGNETQFSYADNFYTDSSPAQNPPASFAPPMLTNAFPTAITFPIIGAFNLRYYYGSGKPAFTVDQNGSDTYFHYLDSLDRLTHTFLPVTNGNRGWTLTTYSSNETQIDTFSAINDTTPSIYCTSCVHTVQYLDSLGRPIESTLANDPENATYALISYDTSGHTHTVTNPYRTTSDQTYGVTTLSYDGLGRPTVVVEADNSKVKLYYGSSVSGAGGISSQLCALTTYGYGYPMLQIDEVGNKKQTWANGFGETIEVDEPNSSGALSVGTCYGHDALGNLTSVAQMGGTTDSTQWRNRTFVYDGLSRVTSATEPESGNTTYTYDNNGNVLTKTAPAPNQTGTATVTTTYTYDALNRLKTKIYSDGTTPSVQYTYDVVHQYANSPIPQGSDVGRLTATWTSGKGTEYSHDKMGRVAYLFDCVEPTSCNNSLVGSYQFDLAGDITQASYQMWYWNGTSYTATTSPLTFNQSFDTATRPTQLTSSLVDAQHPATLVSTDPSVGYFPHGALRKAALGNGLTETNVYNNRLQPCLIDVNNNGTLLQTCNDNTPSGNILDLWMAYNVGYKAGNDNGNVINWNASGAQAFVRVFGYDPANRLAIMTETSGSAESCKPASSSTNNYTLSWTIDAWGNRTAQSPSAGTCSFSQGVNTRNQLFGSPYQYDAAGNMIHDALHSYTYDAENRLIQVDGGSTATYAYDPLGRRVTKTIGGTTTNYAYDLGQDALFETQGSSWVTAYIYFGDALTGEYTNGTTYFLHQDHLGSTRLVTGMTYPPYPVVDSLDYLPFGEQISGATVATHKFTGYERDSESELDNASTRHYSNSIGRFMQPDPLSGFPSNPQSWNRYSYVYNNPLNSVDPTGMCPPDSEDSSDCPGVGDLSQWDLWNWNYVAILGYGGGWNSTDTYNYSDVFANPIAQPWWTNPAAENFPQGDFFDFLWGALGGFAKSLGASLNCIACTPQYQAFVDQQAQPRSNLEAIGWKLGPLAGLFIPGMGEEGAVEEGVERGLVGVERGLVGDFSILDWSGYPGGLRPEGPFRILEGAEYESELAAKKAANAALHDSLGLRGGDIHEIQPVKFAGSPTSMANKIVLDPQTHRQYTKWWAKLLRDLLRNR